MSFCIYNHFETASSVACCKLRDVVASITTMFASFCITGVIKFMKGVEIAVDPAYCAGRSVNCSAAVGHTKKIDQKHQSTLANPTIYWLVRANGSVAEWSKAHAWKVCRRETVSRVRIPVDLP